ncbi:MAG: NUDIX hydrolase [Burkholderiales bacterium]
MAIQRWTPRVTAAAVIEQAGRYLLIEEHTRDGLRLNNPCGHLEPGESPLDAVVREALEEAARPFTPTSLVGIYLSRQQRPEVNEDVSHLRLAFAGPAGPAIIGRALDRGIVRTLWMTPDEVRTHAARLRSPTVLQCIQDHSAGRRFPLDLLSIDPSVYTSLLAAHAA